MEDSVKPDSPLAQIVKILAIEPIPEADNIVLATVLGWNVVIQKNTHEIGELAIYFSIGSILDKVNPDTSFLKGKVLKSRKIKGVLSQGLLGPLSWLQYYNVDPKSVVEGQDVTEIMQVRKYVSKDEKELYGEPNELNRIKYPEFIPKTAERRLQNIPHELERLKGQEVVITQKYDGTSTTYITHNGKFAICSRNFLLAKQEDSISHHFKIADKYDLENKMLKLNRNIAIQGELIGPNIGPNAHGVKCLEYYVFNIYDIDQHSYLDYQEVVNIINQLGLKMVPVIYVGPMKDEWLSVPALLALAEEQLYLNGEPGEGIIVKTNGLVGSQRLSFKAISNKYLFIHDR